MQSDQQLIRRIKGRKSKTAANELISRYYKEIYAYTYRQTGEVELAKDLTQEIFLHILEKISDFDEKRAGFRTWVYRLAGNWIRDYYRSRSYKHRQLELPVEEGQEELETYEPLLYQQMQAEVEDLSSLIVKRELIGRIMQVVAAYPPQWGVIFQKKCFEEQTFAEIAMELAISENTVKTRFYQMIRKIKKVVKDNE